MVWIFFHKGEWRVCLCKPRVPLLASPTSSPAGGPYLIQAVLHKVTPVLVPAGVHARFPRLRRVRREDGWKRLSRGEARGKASAQEHGGGGSAREGFRGAAGGGTTTYNEDVLASAALHELAEPAGLLLLLLGRHKNTRIGSSEGARSCFGLESVWSRPIQSRESSRAPTSPSVPLLFSVAAPGFSEDVGSAWLSLGALSA